MQIAGSGFLCVIKTKQPPPKKKTKQKPTLICHFSFFNILSFWSGPSTGASSPGWPGSVSSAPALRACTSTLGTFWWPSTELVPVYFLDWKSITGCSIGHTQSLSCFTRHILLKQPQMPLATFASVPCWLMLIFFRGVKQN